jgi:hypothetical protein
MNDTKHISQEEFNAFQSNQLDVEQTEIFLTHICSCNFCSDQLANLMSEEIIPAPRDMKDNILKATKRPDVQLAKKARETSKQMQLFLYSLKVGTATIGALLLLLLTINMTELPSSQHKPQITQTITEDTSPISTSIRDGIATIKKRLFDFSNNIMNTEVINNDQKEK